MLGFQFGQCPAQRLGLAARTGIGGTQHPACRDFDILDPLLAAAPFGDDLRQACVDQHAPVALDLARAPAPVELDASDPLASLGGRQNQVVLDTDILGPIGIQQLDGGLIQTAYALLSDLVTLARGLGRTDASA